MNYSEAKLFVESLKSARANNSDKQASESIGIYPTMKYSGELIEVGTRIKWNGGIKKAAVDLWDREENNPDYAPTLWEDIAYKDGIRIIPEVITVTSAFALNELGWWGDEIYKSLLDANVYNPEQYPQGWEIQLREVI